MKRTNLVLAAALLAASVFALPERAHAQSTVNWNSLKRGGEAHPRPWCGQWWGYRCNGIAINNKNNRVPTMTCGYDDALSPAEKLDAAAGRNFRIEYAKLDTWLKCSLAAWSDCQGKVGPDRQRCLTDATKGQKYLACAQDPKNRLIVDTAYEHELANKGQGVFGWDAWWGQCNAWAAASVMYAEPTHVVTAAQQKGGVFAKGWHPQQFTVADVKGLLTSAHNDIEMAADGWFGCRYDGPGQTRLRGSCATDQEAYEDVTPRDMLSALSKHIGADRHGVVIDRHTDWEVWNQPVWKYSVTNCKESTDEAFCGGGATKQTCQLSFTWAEESVGPGEVCVPPHGYVERTLAFSVCVRGSNILPARKYQRWEVPDSVAKSERWPDFLWVPGHVSEDVVAGNPFVHKHFDQIVELAKLSAGEATAPSLKQQKSYDHKLSTAIPAQSPVIKRDIPVSDSFKVKGAAVCVDITHPVRYELIVALVGPDGKTRIPLWTRSSGAEDNLKDCVDASHPSFYNKPAKGTWSVEVSAPAATAAGTWNSVSLRLMH